MIKKYQDNKNIIKNLESFYDQRSLEWKRLYEKKLYPSDVAKIYRGKLAKYFVNKFLKENSKILDAGCGAGKVLLDIVENYEVQGIDVSSKMIELCNKEFEHANIDKNKYKFSIGNLFDSDLKEKSFDGIIALGFLEYQKNENISLKYLRSLLKPNGLIIISGPSNIRLYNYFGLVSIIEIVRRVLSRKKRDDYKVDWETICLHKYSISRFKNILFENKFKFIEGRQHSYAGLRYINKIIGLKGQFKLSNFLSKFFELINFNRFADDIIIVAKREE